MPMLEKYRHYFDIDPDYFPAVNEAVINKNPEMWKKFFPQAKDVPVGGRRVWHGQIARSADAEKIAGRRRGGYVLLFSTLQHG